MLDTFTAFHVVQGLAFIAVLVMCAYNNVKTDVLHERVDEHIADTDALINATLREMDEMQQREAARRWEMVQESQRIIAGVQATLAGHAERMAEQDKLIASFNKERQRK